MVRDMSLGERLRAERQRAGLTKTALALPRYTVSYVSQIEAGKRSPSPDALAYFAERLQLSPDFLATGIPDGIEAQLRFELEDGRLALRQDRHEDAEGIAKRVLDEAER